MNNDDINAAVDAGILTAEQGARLGGFMSERRNVNGPTTIGRNEPFRILRNFNEVFLSIGVVLVLFAVTMLGSSFLTAKANWLEIAAFTIAALGTTVFLAEIFANRMRTVAPSFILAAAAAYFVATAAMSVLFAAGMERRFFSIETAICLAVAALTAYLYFLRYRLPAATLIVAAAGAASFVIFVVSLLGLSQTSLGLAAATLMTGLALFVGALSFDFQDPARRTRAHQIGFWLHLVAAPLIVHSMFLMLAPTDGSRWLGHFSAGVPSILVVLPLIAVLALIALALDRRAILVSSLAYVAGAISSVVSQVGSGQAALVVTPLILGFLVLLLGAQWQEIRRLILAKLPRFPLSDRLPTW